MGLRLFGFVDSAEMKLGQSLLLGEGGCLQIFAIFII